VRAIELWGGRYDGEVSWVKGDPENITRSYWEHERQMVTVYLPSVMERPIRPEDLPLNYTLYPGIDNVATVLMYKYLPDALI
jgi:hypothetical protein